MGRRVRRVPADWVHPKHKNGALLPLMEPDAPLDVMRARWEQEKIAWDRGEHPDRRFARDGMPFEEWDPPPSSADYMPWWPPSERTHYQMYETTSEGTPISPVCATPEILARWLVDNGASGFAHLGYSYEEWLAIAQGSPSIGLVFTFDADRTINPITPNIDLTKEDT